MGLGRPPAGALDPHRGDGVPGISRGEGADALVGQGDGAVELVAVGRDDARARDEEGLVPQGARARAPATRRASSARARASVGAWPVLRAAATARSAWSIPLSKELRSPASTSPR